MLNDEDIIFTWERIGFLENIEGPDRLNLAKAYSYVSDKFNCTSTNHFGPVTVVAFATLYRIVRDNKVIDLSPSGLDRFIIKLKYFLECDSYKEEFDKLESQGLDGEVILITLFCDTLYYD